MLAVVLAIVLGLTSWQPWRIGLTQHGLVLVADAAHGDLRKNLMDSFAAMNSANKGIFHDDVSSVVAPYFPLGQTFADTQTVIAAQHIGPLKPFKGKQIGGPMYVTKLNLMAETFGDIDVVLDFEFSGHTESDMVLTKVKAYVRATNM